MSLGICILETTAMPERQKANLWINLASESVNRSHVSRKNPTSGHIVGSVVTVCLGQRVAAFRDRERKGKDRIAEREPGEASLWGPEGLKGLLYACCTPHQQGAPFPSCSKKWYSLS